MFRIDPGDFGSGSVVSEIDVVTRKMVQLDEMHIVPVPGIVEILPICQRGIALKFPEVFLPFVQPCTVIDARSKRPSNTGFSIVPIWNCSLTSVDTRPADSAYCSAAMYSGS